MNGILQARREGHLAGKLAQPRKVPTKYQDPRCTLMSVAWLAGWDAAQISKQEHASVLKENQ